jgi:hypothetical protein
MVFNECEMLYLLVELPGRWVVPPLKEDLPGIREACIADSQDYDGTFITTVGHMAPIGDLDTESIVWSVTQQRALP